MSNNTWTNLMLIAGVVLLILVPFLMVTQTGDGPHFAGTDDQAGALITHLQPGFRPWFNSLWKPPSSEIQSLLFALQAAIGAGFLGYYFGLKRGQRMKPPPGGTHAPH